MMHTVLAAIAASPQGGSIVFFLPEHNAKAWSTRRSSAKHIKLFGTQDTARVEVTLTGIPLTALRTLNRVMVTWEKPCVLEV